MARLQLGQATPGCLVLGVQLQHVLQGQNTLTQVRRKPCEPQQGGDTVGVTCHNPAQDGDGFVLVAASAQVNCLGQLCMGGASHGDDGLLAS
jgi:hypothetical protein